MSQWLIVMGLIAVAAGYVTWGFMTTPARQRLLDALARRGLLRAYAARHRARFTDSTCSRCSAAGTHRPLRR